MYLSLKIIYRERLRISGFVLFVALGLLNQACYSPVSSQKYFVEATVEDRILEPIYSTAIYTVYFDYVLARCVIHSSHTWGQNGGGGGGTGVGIVAFRCDPDKIRGRARYLGIETNPPKFKRNPRTVERGQSPTDEGAKERKPPSGAVSSGPK